MRADKLIPFRSQARSVSTTHVRALRESFCEYGKDYSIRMVSVVKKGVNTEKYTKQTLSDDFWEIVGTKAHMEAVELKGENGYVGGSY